MKSYIIPIIFFCASVALCHGQNIADIRRALPQSIKKHIPIPERLLKEQKQKKEEKQRKTYKTGNLSNLNFELRYMFKQAFMEDKTDVTIIDDGEFTFIKPNFRIANSSLLKLSAKKSDKIQKEKSKKKPQKFSANDDIACAYISPDYKIMIVKHSGLPCIMQEFEFVSNSDILQITNNQIIFPKDIRTLFDNNSPNVFKIQAVHKPSGRSYIFILQAIAPLNKKCPSEINTYAIKYDNTLKKNHAILLDFKNKTAQVIKLPFILNAKGIDGKRGYNGSNGIQGTDSWQMKTDKGTLTMPGTCGTDGQNGGRGGDGGDGGFIVMAYDVKLYNKNKLDDITIYTNKGLGGPGGQGGAPGRHGKGSFCFTTLYAGANGPDGKDGKEGDYTYIITNLDQIKLVEK